MATRFYKDVRCGIIHDTETRRKWIISYKKAQDAIVDEDSEGNFVLNRTRFHAALCNEFEDWLAILRGGNMEARRKMQLRMQSIIKIHFGE
jgi:hypothetical protein